jgi:hydroxymethylpyrimidine pyrophosphatase-like HAD family hydrolase
MIETAGIGCAMANATPACKEAADYITEKDCDHSGLAEIIEKFMITA